MNTLEKEFLLAKIGQIGRIVRNDYSANTDLLKLCDQIEDFIRLSGVKE